MKSLCYQAKLTPYLSSKTKVADTGSGTATLNIDPVHLTYTRTIVFSDLSFPTKEVHDERAILEGFPTNVQAGSYTQSIAEHPFNAHYFKELELKTVGTFLTFSGEDLLHGTYIPCHQTLSSSALSAPRKQLRGSA